MKLYRVGEKSRALCPFCKRLQVTTFEERDVPLKSGKGTVPSVLAAVCDGCDQVVGIPQQSAPLIQDVVRRTRHPVEARIPRHLSDAVNLVAHRLGPGPQASTVLFRYYVQRFAGNKGRCKALKSLASSDEAVGRSTSRFSTKLSDDLYQKLKTIRDTTGLSDAKIIRGLIVQMKRDILDNKAPKVREDLEAVMRLAG